MPYNTPYPLFANGRYERIPLKEIARAGSALDARLWSARLSTGLLGSTNCDSGNRGPKEYGEILLALGDEGLRKLVELGFIPCSSCRPETTDTFWDIVAAEVAEKYHLYSREDFTNKDILPYDARRVQWEEIIPHIGKAPGRLYVPQGLSQKEVAELAERFAALSLDTVPSIGFYDRETAAKFTAYDI